MLHSWVSSSLVVLSLSVSGSALAVERNAQGDVISAEAAAVQRAQAKKLIKAAKVDGLLAESLWQLNFDWGCTGFALLGTVTVHPDNTYEDSFGSFGTWVRDKKNVTFTYANGTVYSGVLSDGNQHAAGTMISFAGHTGCWTSDRQ